MKKKKSKSKKRQKDQYCLKRNILFINALAVIRI